MRARRPNILIVLADDFGVHQLGCHGSTFFETPHLDAFARSALRFSSAYSTSPICSPARAGIYTGRHPALLHLTNYIPGTEPPNGRLLTPPWSKGLPVEEVTLGDAFKQAGYQTAHFGKWHLAPDYNYRPGRPMDPESQGFDEVFVTLKPPPNADPEQDPHHIDELTGLAIDFLRRDHESPFLCIMAHNAVHRPEMAPAALVRHFAAKPGSDFDPSRPVLAAMTAQIDAAFGRLLEALDSGPHAGHTIVVFVSDHGAFGRSADRKPYRGAKADLYEAGLRVPLIVRMPAPLRRSGESDSPVSTSDVFPTLLDLAGVPRPSNDLDGISFASLLQGTGDPPAREAFHWHYPHYHHLGLGPCGAVRRGRHKLIEWFDGSIAGAAGVPAYELFDLQSDPCEYTDLAPDQPVLRDALARELRRWRRSVDAQEMVINPAFDPSGGGTNAPPPRGDAVNPYAE